jgi:ketosteroid isomerase-like protein
MSSDEQRIRELHATRINAVNAGELDRLLTLMTDDVVFLNPAEPRSVAMTFPPITRQLSNRFGFTASASWKKS